jgi:hypothetical protein
MAPFIFLVPLRIFTRELLTLSTRSSKTMMAASGSEAVPAWAASKPADLRRSVASTTCRGHRLRLLYGVARELAIWTAHEEDSIREGLGRETVKALAENRRVSDMTYSRAVAKFGEEGVVQATVIEGLYTYMSMAVNMAYPESAGHGRLAPFPQ